MTIHELDELDEMQPWFNGRRAVTASLAGDCEETAVRIDVPSKSGGVIFASVVVLHRGDDVVDVRLPDGFMAYADAAGLPYEAAAEFEGFLCTLARMAFARGGR
jgi:hypothetical protein